MIRCTTGEFEKMSCKIYGLEPHHMRRRLFKLKTESPQNTPIKSKMQSYPKKSVVFILFSV